MWRTSEGWGREREEGRMVLCSLGWVVRWIGAEVETVNMEVCKVGERESHTE